MVSKFITSITDTKLRDKILDKNPEDGKLKRENIPETKIMSSLRGPKLDTGAQNSDKTRKLQGFRKTATTRD